MVARDQRILVSFYADDETAQAVAEHMRIAVTALCQLTEDSASELFRIGAEAVVQAGQIERTREAMAG